MCNYARKVKIKIFIHCPLERWAWEKNVQHNAFLPQNTYIIVAFHDYHTYYFSDKPSGSGCSGTGYFEVDNSKTWSKTIYLSYRSSRSCWWYIYNPNPKRQMVLTVDNFHVSYLILTNYMANWRKKLDLFILFFLLNYLRKTLNLFLGVESWLCTSKIQ